MPRAHRPLRTLTVVLAIPILLGTLVGPATAAGRAPVDGLAVTLQVEHASGTREIGRRGRVDAERALRDVRASDPGPTAAGSDVTGDPATQNDTTPPTLSKLPLQGPATDPTVGVGPDHVVRADRDEFLITHRTGASAQVVEAADLFLLPDVWDGWDARIYFDPRQQRWIALETSRRCDTAESALDIAISDTADPTAGWSVYFFAYQDAEPVAPGFANSTDKWALTAYVKPMDTGCQPQAGDALWDVTVLDIPQALAGTEDDARYFTFLADGEADSVQHLAPAVQQPPTSATAWVIAHAMPTSAPDSLPFALAITGTGSSTQVNAPVDLTGAGLDVHDPPPVVQQPGWSFGVSSTPTAAAWRAGRLAYTQSVDCVPTDDDGAQVCQRVVELTTSGTSASVRQDLLLAVDDRDTYHGSLAYTGRGDLLVSYSRSSATTAVSTSIVRQAAGDAVGTVSAAVALEAGSGLYASSLQDWIGGAQDPLDADAVWLSGIASDDGSHVVRTAQALTFDGATFETIAPARVLDTRFDVGLANPFPSNTPRTFQVAGVGAIPDDAIAITANVTVAGQTGAGYVSVSPTATNTPTSSTLNFPTGDNRANNVTVPLDAGGKLAAVYKSSSNRTTELIVDVTGYFVADDSASTYEPITPARLLDTRAGVGLGGGFNANVPRSFQITGGTIPTGAVAITGNLTVTGQSRGGYVSVTPTPTANPTTSTINFPSGDTRANGLTIPLSGSGSLSAVYKTSSGSTHLILDVTGYYVAGDDGLRFYPLQPGRILDTRATSLTLLTGKFTSSSARTLSVGGHFAVPETAQAVTGNLTVTGQTKGGYVSITKTKTNSPAVSTLNMPSGDTRANGVTVPLDGNDDLHLVYKSSSGATTHLLLDLTGYFR
jgi:hypothetical protein